MDDGNILRWRMRFVRAMPICALCAGPAHAVLIPAPDLMGDYEGCKTKFEAAGLGQQIEQLRRSTNTFRIKPATISSNSKEENLAASHGGKPGTGGETTWAPNGRAILPGDKFPQDPCASLYHEMAHLVSYDNGLNDDRKCGASDLPINEVMATRAENVYRRSQPNLKGQIREYYFDEHKNLPVLLPSEEYKCDPTPRPRPPPPPRSRSMGCSVGPAVGCPTPATDDSHSDATNNPISVANSNGDVHLTTYDELYYDLQLVGEFVLTGSSVTRDFEIQTRQGAFPGSTTVSVNTAVAMNVVGDRVGLYVTPTGSQLRINGRSASLSSLPIRLSKGGRIEHTGDDEIRVRWPDGSEALLFEIGPFGYRVRVHPAVRHRGHLFGLLGDFDGKPENDLRRPNGRIVLDHRAETIHRQFGDSWRIDQRQSLFDYAPGESTSSFTNRAFPSAFVDVSQLPNAAAAQAECRRAGVTRAALVRECVFDLTVTGQSAFAKSTAHLEKVLSRSDGKGAANSAPNIRFTGSVNGVMVVQDTNCTLLGAAKQFNVQIRGTVAARQAEILVTIADGYHGPGEYQVGSVLSNNGIVSASIADRAVSSDGGHVGRVTIQNEGKAGTMNVQLGDLSASGAWACTTLTRL
jgi:hypothetical protein